MQNPHMPSLGVDMADQLRNMILEELVNSRAPFIGKLQNLFLRTNFLARNDFL